MQCRAAAPSRAAPPAAPAALWQRRRQHRLHVAAAERQQQQQQGPEVPDAPPAPKPKGVKVELFETMGMDAPAAGAPAGDNPVAALLSTIDFSEPMSFDGEEKTEYDPLRDGPLRYLGYANELGEAFAAWLFAGGVPLSYAVAIGYVCFDTWDKWVKTEADARQKLAARPGIPASVDLKKLIKTIGFERGIDTLVWQLIASVAAPGYTIHTVVAAATWALAQAEQSQQVLAALEAAAGTLGVGSDTFIETFNKSVPTALGLAAIPFIVHPIDAGVHAVLNATLRPAMRRYICRDAGGADAGLVICDCDK